MKPRLIDANKLSKDIQDYFTGKINKGEYEVDTVDCNADIQAILRKQPTAYDLEEKLQRLVEESITDPAGHEWVRLEEAIEIVKGASNETD